MHKIRTIHVQAYYILQFFHYKYNIAADGDKLLHQYRTNYVRNVFGSGRIPVSNFQNFLL